MAKNQIHVFSYACASSVIAILILIHGSIPRSITESKLAEKSDLPDTIDDVRIVPQTLYHSHVQNLVLFVIDGFGLEDSKDSNFPYVSELIRHGEACYLSYRAHPLSTTIQKFQTLASGSSIGFLNHILKFEDSKQADNIFRLAKENKLRISFHGSESLFQLFPDYINVEKLETNNSRGNYFTKDHWDWFVFHHQAWKNSEYLYPAGRIIKLNNLRYVDGVISSFHKVLKNEEKPFTILITGDSGTRDLRNPNEFKKNPNTFAPFIIIQKDSCLLHIQNYRKGMQEFDLAPMISVLNGLPIPSSSHGSLHHNLLFDFTLEEKMYASYYNTRKLMDNLVKLGATNYTDSECPSFQKIVSDHGNYLRNSEKNKTASTEILESYENLMNCFSQIINEVRMQPNASIQFLALILLIEALIMILNAPNEKTENLNQNIIFGFGFHVLLTAFILGVGMWKRVTSFASMSQEETIIIAIIGIIMICNSCIISKQKSFISIICSALITKAKISKESLETLSSKIEAQIPPIKTHENSIHMILVLGTIFQSVSLLEFGFVKCEKWTWYFLWTSICGWTFMSKVQNLYENACSTDREKREKFNDYQGQISIIVSIMVMHRIILSYTEIEHWLQYSHNSICASMCLFFGLIILAFLCSICYEPFSNYLEKVIISTCLLLTSCAIFALKVAEGKATLFYYPLSSTGTIESILFWFGYSFIFIYGLVISTIKTCFTGESSAKELIASLIGCCTMFMALQSSISHVILISMQILYSLAFSDVLKNHKNSSILSHVWLGYLFFHYQQNQVLNSDNVQEAVDIFSSMDYYSIVRGLLAILHKFSAPILAYFLCIYGQLNNNPKTRASKNVSKINEIFMSCRLMIIIACALGIMFRSASEWSWTFLSMKLLNEGVNTVLLFIISLGAQVLVSLHDITLAPSTSRRVG